MYKLGEEASDLRPPFFEDFCFVSQNIMRTCVGYLTLVSVVFCFVKCICMS